ncbi:glycoside hydrolase family 43 protein [Chitinophaga pendula]|uniref:glycoside hydrolase family 43 protein n=1 Tax=Chitinophaga TaxID=79328 RepID=UPI000BAF9E73|nr:MULTISPECIES: glycoside hydrolase family 43 protein [Chitinophaga]ASZ11877.1 beta-xylosidase [Chitinophaga sp. MD30]UCJ05098.1 glycoside hydrolase family 43 protein [Chitinophaga pendula]
MWNTSYKRLCSLVIIAVLMAVAVNSAAQPPAIFLADPTIFVDKGIFYSYGTGSSEGFPYYTSLDGKSWRQGPDSAHRLALTHGDAYGSSGFWAPQVFKRGNNYYMAYTANEQIAIAKASSPAGPFRQDAPVSLSGSGRQIDPFLFFDKDGKVYLYHVKLQAGNRIFVAEMKSDLSDVVPGTEKECIASTEAWENTAGSEWPVTEGPTVFKRNNLYYLLYSANDFRSKDYAVGYATATSPTGPWKKYSGNPIISRQTVHQNGSGHGDVFYGKDGSMYYVFHTHRSAAAVSPRATAAVRLTFRPTKNGADVLEADGQSFRWLTVGP